MQFFKYQISGGGASSNPSVGLNGSAIPTSGTLIAGKDPGGLSKPVSVDVNGVLNVNAVVQGGDATAANQVLEIAQLTAINGKLPATLGTKTSAASLAVVLASDQAALAITAASLPLPTGASTSALQTSGNASLTSLDGKFSSLGQKASAASAPVVLASDQSAIPSSQSGTWNINNVSGTVSLPTGASTETTLSALNGKFAALGQHTSASSVSVVLSSDSSSLPVKIVGKASSGFARNDYSSVPVTTGAYVTIIASTASAASEIYVFDSSGQTLVLAIGAAASEVDQFLIIPGGNGSVPLAIPAGSRISVKAVSASATVGELDLNLLG